MVIGSADGSLEVYHSTSEKQMMDLPPPEVEGKAGAGAAKAIVWSGASPKEDAIFCVNAGGELRRWEFKPKHPEAGLKSLFLPVWYEGNPAPKPDWQSTIAEGSE